MNGRCSLCFDSFPYLLCTVHSVDLAGWPIIIEHASGGYMRPSINFTILNKMLNVCSWIIVIFIVIVIVFVVIFIMNHYLISSKMTPNSVMRLSLVAPASPSSATVSTCICCEDPTLTGATRLPEGTRSEDIACGMESTAPQ